MLAASGELPVIPQLLKVIDQLAQPCQLTGFSTRDFYLIAPAAFHSFFSPLVFFLLDNNNGEVFLSYMVFIHLPQKCMYLHFFDELCCKHSSYLLKNQLLQGYKIR